MASTSTSAPVAAAKVPNATTTSTKARSSSNGSMGSQGSETGRLLKSLGSVDGFADIGTGLEPSGAPVAAVASPPVAATAKAPTEPQVEAKAAVDDSETFPVPASIPQHEHAHKPASAAATTDVPIEDRKPAAAPAPPAEVILHVSFPKDLKPTMEESESSSKQPQQGGGQQHHSRNLPERRLQPKKRKMSYESYDTGLGDHTQSSSSFLLSKRKMSYESYGSALMADSKDSNNSNSNFSRRKMSYESYGSAMGDISLGLESLDSDIIQKQPPDVGSVATKESGASDKSPPAPHVPLPTLGVSALDHLDALGDEGAEADADAGLPPPAPVAGLKKAPEDAPIIGNASIIRDAEQQEEADENATTSDATFTSSGHRLLMEAIMMTNGGTATGGGRKRLESWGGMSDLSFQPAGGTTGHDHYHRGGGGVDAAAAIAASALQHTGLIDDVMAAANFGADSEASSVTDDLVGAKLRSSSLEHFMRERKESTTSYSDGTFALPGSATSDGVDISSDIQKFVSQAVASVGDQLAELAGNIESAVEVVDLDKQHQYEEASQASKGSQSTATPLTALVLGASLDDPSRVTISGQSSTHQAGIDRGESRKNVEEAAASAAAISVDYDAVAAAVDAANAAIGGLDLSSIGNGAIPGATVGKSKPPLSQNKKRGIDKMSFTASMNLLGDVPKSSLSEKEQDEIRERARRAAGYVPPSQLPNGALKTPAKNRALPPLKKRIKRATPEPGSAAKSMSYATPKVSNVSGKSPLPSPALSSTPHSSSKSGGKEKSTQKWDSMYDCLLKFVVDQKKEETAGFNSEELAEWSWDGNVPTTYKTKDGKALGRWINNQRSAKSKGTLKGEREQRLVNAGLKWSVLASNSWNEMLDELRIYIKEYIKEGKKWDGNVPTNYRIKARANGKKMTEEDKNLGRWVNRQRSLYQAGKLRKDRQLALEKVGLKWSMLATTSWDSMYDTLLVYVREKRKRGIKWDGNVPANFKTDDNPPRALGRWINRQRSAHVKKKLKMEYVDKLTLLGLKWSVHERKYHEDGRGDELEDDEDIIPEHAISENAAQPPALVLSGVNLSTTAKQIPATVAVPAANAQLKPPPVETGKNNNCDIRPEQVSSGQMDVSDRISPSSQDTVKGNNKQTQLSSEAKDPGAKPLTEVVVKIKETANQIPAGTANTAASVPVELVAITPKAPAAIATDKIGATAVANVSVTFPSLSATSSSQAKLRVSQPELSGKAAETKGDSESAASEGATTKQDDSVENEASRGESKATGQDTENPTAAPVTVSLSINNSRETKSASKSQTQETIGATQGVDTTQAEQSASLPEEADLESKEGAKLETVREAEAATLKPEISSQRGAEATKDPKSSIETPSSQAAPESLAVSDKEDANSTNLPATAPTKATVANEATTSDEEMTSAPAANDIPEDGTSICTEERSKTAEERPDEFAETSTPSVAKEAPPREEDTLDGDAKQTTEVTPASYMSSTSQTMSTPKPKKGAKASKLAAEKGDSVKEPKGKTKGKSLAPRRTIPSRNSRVKDKPVEKRSTPRRSTRSR